MKTLQQRDMECIWHPFTPQKQMSPPLPIVKGEGTLLFDENGKTYIDAISSWWVTLHGHANAYIAQQLYHQALTLEQVIFAGFTHQPAVQLAENLLQVLPPAMARIFYSDNGSTATEVALKMAIQYWWNNQESERNTIVAFNNSYHGDTFGAMSVSDRSVFTLAFANRLFEVLFIDTPSADNIAGTLHLLKQRKGTIAAFIYEPLVQGAGGMKMYDAALLDTLLGTLQADGAICIADEVMTGFGRTGRLFASNYLQHQPDIMCLSKGLTGGTMALGVTACSQRIYQAFVTNDKLKTFFHGHSFTANPLACTAANASLHLLQQDTCTQAIAGIGAWNQQLARVLHGRAGIKNVRTLGTIIAFELDAGRDEYLNNIGSEVTRLMMDKGVYLRPLGNTVYLMPPYCITQQEYTAVKAALLACLHVIAP